MSKVTRVLGRLSAAVVACLGLAAAARGDVERPPVLLEIEGVINPLTERYLKRGLESAAREKRSVVIIRLDTPGGTMDSTRSMCRALLGSPVPTVVYVGPPGARAASAGMFITAAAHIAAMAPGTNIGSAHPVALGRGNDKPDDDVMSSKIVNDAAALARAIAAERGRNAGWLEKAVRESVSVTAAEATKLDVVDLVAPDMDALLDRIDGRRVRTVTGEQVLRTAGLTLEARPMGLAERLLHVITDPNIAYILFTLGLIGLAAELYSPGLIFPGVVGGVALVLALVAFGSLPINWAGIVLLVVGLALVAADLLTAGLGLLAIGGAIAFILGSLMLYRPFGPPDPGLADLSLSPWVVGATGLTLAVFFGVTLRAVVRAQRARVQTGREALIGREGISLSPLEPIGTVRVESEVWSARSDGEHIQAGAPVRVISVDGVVLHVRHVRNEEGDHVG